MSNNTDRRLAVATPIALLMLGLLINAWAIWFLPAVLYFVYRHCGWAQARETTLRLADLHLSLLVLAIPLGLLLGSLGIVANDAGIDSWLVKALSNLLIIVLSLYTFISYIFFSVKAHKGQLHSAKLNMGIIEALRGKRASRPEAPSTAS